MKKYLILLIVTSFSYSQNLQFSLAVDVRNAIVGSTPTNDKPEIDFVLGFQMIGNEGIVVGIYYERFNAIAFTKYNIAVGYIFQPIDKLKVIPDVEFGIISRQNFNDFKGEASFFTLGANIAFQYEFSYNFDIALKSKLSHRTDLDYMYGGENWIVSNYLCLVYKIY